MKFLNTYAIPILLVMLLVQIVCEIYVISNRTAVLDCVPENQVDSFKCTILKADLK